MGQNRVGRIPLKKAKYFLRPCNSHRMIVLRATLSYEGIGVYFQVPTMSTMRSNTQDLFPIKFGITLTMD